MKTLFRKVLVSERLPSKSGSYITSSASGVIVKKYYNSDFGQFIYQSYHGDTLKSNVEYWLEEIQLPSEKEVTIEANKRVRSFEVAAFKSCYNYILGFINNKK